MRFKLFNDLPICQFNVPINIQMGKTIQTIFGHCRSEVVFQPIGYFNALKLFPPVAVVT
jgi:hypothetical protein